MESFSAILQLSVKKKGMDMIQIAFVVPYPEMEPIIHETWQLHTEEYKKTKLEDQLDFSYFVDTGISPSNIASRKYNADVIVSRGGTALGLKEMHYFTPIIEIPLTSRDIRQAINKAIESYGRLPIGIVGTRNMLSTVNMMDRSDIDVKVFITESVDEHILIQGVNEAVKSGRQIIIGGINTVNYCMSNGIKSQMLVSSHEAIWQSITEAKRAAIITNQERQRTALYEAMLDQMFEGLVSVDNKGHIQIINSAAARMFGLHISNAVGQPMENVLPPGRMIYVLKSKETFSNEIIKYGSNQFVLNCVPIQFGNTKLGAVATFQNANTIVEAESGIRTKTYSRGHVAKHHFYDIIGESEIIKSVKTRASKFAAVDSSILLLGETGTGKELFAQSIHNESARKEGPFVAVNCAALPENLMESELFGYVAGAFTGASKSGKPGLFELAHLGTIFLDEISEIPPRLQSRLLRVIQEREIMRLGHDRVIPIDVRIICATNEDLLKLIKKGKFREDLYYRINVLSIELPPLRERESDVILIMRGFLDVYCKHFNKAPLQIPPEVENFVRQYSWEGNIRQLRNICEQLAVINTTGFLSMNDLKIVLPNSGSFESKNQTAALTPISNASLGVGLAELEKMRIIEALKESKSKAEAAEILGIGRTTLWRKLKEYGLA